MRILRAIVLTLPLAIGCSGDDEEPGETGGTEETGEDTESDVHPLVPEEFGLLWNTEGCETQDGKDGSQVYWHVTDAAIDASGQFTATERWYWFHSEPGWASDCVDTWSIEGEFATFDYGMLGCSQCEEGYEYTRTLTDSQCSITYYSLFSLEKEERPDDEIYEGMLLMDTMGPLGNLNERTLVVNGALTPGGYSMNYNYAWGAWTPNNADEPTPGEPGAYSWLGDACVGSGN